MIAMQYSLSLPADYDMGIIDRRIRDKGSLLGEFPNLKFKAYLRAAKGDLGSHENLYAPFYVWDKADGASDFLCGPGFQTLANDFGWPSVRTWIVWQACVDPAFRQAKFATRDIFPIEPHARLDQVQRREVDEAMNAVSSRNAFASVAGFEPTTWTRIRFRLWTTLPESLPASGVQACRVGHVSAGENN
ncbi:DUF4865 family protein [Microvirga sp. BT689]|uniref:DUF4865 family protein n=1 Tax=Microvirga arvi TaxID=2778731 RepID=UPI00194EF92B|nr:DUF4865 family protein [Microvirga arvi]MBM6581690.1 DUF4865 family protein [Microvirga arvi]